MRPCVFISISIRIIAGSFSFLLLVTGYVNLVTIFNHTGVGVTSIILILRYIKATRHFKSKTKESHTGENRQEKPKTSVEKRHWNKRQIAVTKAFLGILILFICSYTPAVVISYILQFCLKCNCTFRHILRDPQLLIALSNSIMNQILCTIRLKRFRKAIASMLRLKTAISSTVEEQEAEMRNASNRTDFKH